MTYCDRKQLDKVYGKNNVDIWADLDNNKDDQVMSDRITYMIEQAEALVDGRLGNSPYTFPIVDENVPTIISHICALQAGILLYNGRRIVSDENPGQVSAQEAEFEKYVNRILSDTLRLPLTRLSTQPIKVVKTVEPQEQTNGCFNA